MIERLLVTGGAGFIGSALVRYIIEETACSVSVVDKLTYAANLESLASVSNGPRFAFVQADINETANMRALFSDYRPHAVIHLAAETHVDRSIDGPGEFIQTNIVGTFALLQATYEYWRGLPPRLKDAFRFHHVSTDEVFGSLGAEGAFNEFTAYRPSSPYSASKAAADHLVRAWQSTYGLPTLISNCSNNYGPWQFPEKLIPLMIINALEGRPLPVYGNGANVRDWLHVEDHARALFAVATRGRVGETYCIGAQCEKTNLEVVKAICAVMEEVAPKSIPYENLIRFVGDRPGHDLRYAIEPKKIMTDLNWFPRETFESGLRKVAQWYCENRAWWEKIRLDGYGGERLGVVA